MGTLKSMWPSWAAGELHLTTCRHRSLSTSSVTNHLPGKRYAQPR
ncbi:hypothetical protein FOMG_18569 [Fusarium oxysporum f. sp. melonis 26406]|uniref:Uncharacterized protein n=1 Tax=Fusarium oxysporum f. sp. melonis 26406 TaxID=1089452 RepID=W9YZY3_FUSOX|nr:hypothetical protein FOMG_18569 [Fusarium oxysporum f. sp. melonis 26406]